MQKQPPEESYKKAVLKNFPMSSVLDSLFNSEYCEIFQSTYFEEQLRTVASKNVHETSYYDETEKH